MQSFKIEGGHKLKGEISPQGAKNEALQILCAVLLTDQKILINKIIRLKLEAKVKLLKSTRDIQAAMILGDIVVMPSLTPEPFGRVIIEAQALGKIPIAFDHGGASETIIDGKNGFLAKPVDVDSLSKKISLALSLKGSKMEKIGDFAKKNVSKNFSHDRMFNLTL